MFLLFTSQDHVESINCLNNQHPNIKFTYETEKTGEHSFLDVKVNRQDNCFTTTVYRKPTFSGVFTNFYSFIPDVYKEGLMQTLLFRSFHLASSLSKFHIEVTFLKEVLSRNGYPFKIIDRCIKIFLDKQYKSEDCKVSNVPQKKINIVLPFVSQNQTSETVF